jgi:hypothetical protein
MKESKNRGKSVEPHSYRVLSFEVEFDKGLTTLRIETGN